MRTIYDFADVVDLSVVEQLRDCSTDELVNRIDASGSWDSGHGAEALLVLAERRGELDKAYDAEEWTDYWMTICDEKEGKAMYSVQEFLIDENSFGDNFPCNWEEVADYVNHKLENAFFHWKPANYEEAKEIADEVWEDFCNNDTISRFDAMLSLHNGNSYILADELEEHREEILERWDALVNFMEDDVRESLAGEIDDEIEFLAAYLRRAHYDLIVG